jgi:hypothetical protein
MRQIKFEYLCCLNDLMDIRTNRLRELKLSLPSYIKMAVSIEMMNLVLAQMTDLQRRVTAQDATISALKREIDGMKGVSGAAAGGGGSREGYEGMRRPYVTPSNDRAPPRRDRMAHETTVKHSVPLSASSQNFVPTGEGMRRPGKPRMAGGAVGGSYVGGGDRAPPVNLSAILKDGEEVTLQVGLGKGEDGSFTNTYCYANFHGSELTITKCDLVGSMVGEKSDKPGALLYKFIEKLKDGDHINRTFTIAPWKLCSVIREGKRYSLEELRSSA